jgi:hypothetical protein
MSLVISTTNFDWQWLTLRGLCLKYVVLREYAED